MNGHFVKTFTCSPLWYLQKDIWNKFQIVLMFIRKRLLVPALKGFMFHLGLSTHLLYLFLSRPGFSHHWILFSIEIRQQHPFPWSHFCFCVTCFTHLPGFCATVGLLFGICPYFMHLMFFFHFHFCNICIAKFSLYSLHPIDDLSTFCFWFLDGCVDWRILYCRPK